MKFLFLALLFGCASAPPVKKLQYSQTVDHPECFAPLDSIATPLSNRIGSTIIQSTKTTGSLLLTGVGLVSDTAVVVPGLAGTIYLCGDGLGDVCGRAFVAYLGLMKDLHLIWSTERIFDGTSSWRCPEVDHISRAYRKVLACFHQSKEYVVAFAQMANVESDEVLRECLSDAEKEKWERLKDELAFPAI